jgi:hypothetical protein
MHRWLKEKAGKAGYWDASENGRGLPDVALYYFADVTIARGFVEHFGIELKCEGDWYESRDYYGGGARIPEGGAAGSGHPPMKKD